MAEAPQADGEQGERPKERPAPATESEVNPETTTLNGTPLKSILKVKSEPVLHNGSNDNGRLSETGTSVEITASTTLETVTETSLKEKPKAIAKKKVRGVKANSTLSYDNPAFESDGLGGASESHLADIVEKVVGLPNQDAADWHPYGRTSMYEELHSDKQKNGLFESEKIMLWFVFTVMLVGMAGGIIFLSETYNMSLAASEGTTQSLLVNRTM
ncbi:uncharacterized protein LOC124131671 [Haliotis rufescens]|uniref:uncharacterized protein LOC124131671 n=1 Tax=Haliotis rufescens TaxID=6454 RepID=UPI001EAFA47E|nr:uncharacterized protein LOC124131671 [Haliotis rufescens]